MSDCFDYRSDDAEDDEQYDHQSIDNNQNYEDDYYQLDDQSSGRNQYSDNASEENIINIIYIQIMLWEPSCFLSNKNHISLILLFCLQSMYYNHD